MRRFCPQLHQKGFVQPGRCGTINLHLPLGFVMKSHFMLLCFLAAAPPCRAQEAGVCRENDVTGRPVNQAKSDLWQRQFAAREQALMNQIAGQWYTEISANIGGAVMISRQYQTYDASGAYGYQDQTCDANNPQMPCSSNQGYGRWAALTQHDGTIYVARTVSDLNNQDACIGFSAIFADPGHLVDAQSGQLILQRVQ
jgi:hypothetical protein